MTDSRSDTPPKCPSHPEASVIRARIPATPMGVWVCLKCGSRVGDMFPMSPPEKESFSIGTTDVGSAPKFPEKK